MTPNESLGKRLWLVRWKLAGNFLPLALSCLCFAWVISELQVEETMVNLRNSEINAVARGVITIARGMDHLPRDIRFLYSMNDIPAVVSTPSDAVLRKVESIFIAFLNASGTYSQARWIDVEGREKIRVDHNGIWTWTVPDNSLQTKQLRYYFQETMKLPKNGIYISPLDLNVEHDKVMQPYEPTLRVAMPIFDLKDNRQGILVLNQNMSDSLEQLSKIDTDNSITLLDEQGYWLKGELPEDEWGNSLKRPDLRLALRQPKAWQQISNQTMGQFQDQDGLWTFRRVELVPDKLINVANYQLKLPRLTVVSRIPAIKLIELRRNVALPTLALLIVIVIALFFLCAARALAHHARVQSRTLMKAKAEELAHAHSRLEKAYAALRMTQDELIRSEKLSALGLMVAGVAHEINTPLGSALVTVSKIQDAGMALEQRFAEGLRRSDLESYLKLQSEGLALATRNLERAAQLVKSFKQLAADRASEDRHLFSLADTVNECLLLFKNPAKKAHIEFDLNIAPSIKMDSYPGPLSQVLHNLINNAMTHAFDNRLGGRISLSAKVDQQNGLVRIDVADNGSGMEQETLKRVFDPFFTTRRGKGGMGLGLHLSHQIASQVLGATMAVTSDLGQGTCFSLHIPLQAPAAVEADQPVAGPAPTS